MNLQNTAIGAKQLHINLIVGGSHLSLVSIAVNVFMAERGPL